MPILTHIARGSKLRQKTACGDNTLFSSLLPFPSPSQSVRTVSAVVLQQYVMKRDALKGQLIKFKHISCKAGDWNMADLLKGFVSSWDYLHIHNFCVGTHLLGLTVLKSVALTPLTLITDKRILRLASLMGTLPWNFDSVVWLQRWSLPTSPLQSSLDNLFLNLVIAWKVKPLKWKASSIFSL